MLFQFARQWAPELQSLCVCMQNYICQTCFLNGLEIKIRCYLVHIFLFRNKTGIGNGKEVENSENFELEEMSAKQIAQMEKLEKKPKKLNILEEYWYHIRKSCFTLVEHRYFEWFILILILASTVCLVRE